MRKILGGIVLAFFTTASLAEDYYFSCTGVTGVASHQSALPLMSKVITSSESKVSGSMHITADNVTVDGIPWVSSTYLICQDSDQSLWFSLGGSKDHCAGNDLFNDLGAFNKVTGKLNYHVGDFLAILQCKKSKKLIK